MGIKEEMKVAIGHLKKSDPIMSEIIGRIGRCDVRSMPNTFESLARIIAGQQLSSKAADSIFGRVKALNGTKPLSPSVILKLGEEQLRGAGLSNAKTRSIRDLAAHVNSRKLQIKKLEAMETDAVIAKITAVKGMGPWSAEMYLMFVLNRHDVFPIRDLGIRKAMMLHYGRRISEKRMRKIAEAWRPYRTVASLYLWRSLEVVPGPERSSKNT